MILRELPFGQTYPIFEGAEEKDVILKSFFYIKRERERERERDSEFMLNFVVRNR